MSTNINIPDTRPAIAPDRPGHYETRDGGDAVVCIPPGPIAGEATFVAAGVRRYKDRSEWRWSMWTAEGAMFSGHHDSGDLIRYVGPEFREREQESPEPFRITGLGTYRTRAGHEVEIIRHQSGVQFPWYDSHGDSYTNEGRFLQGLVDVDRDIVSRVDEPEPAPVIVDREAEVNTPQPAPDALERLESRVAYLLQTIDHHMAERLESLEQWREVFRYVTANKIYGLHERIDDLATRVENLEQAIDEKVT